MVDKFLMITDVEFWNKNAGNAKRISQFIKMFSENEVKLEVAFVGKIFNKKGIEKEYSVVIKEIGLYQNYFANQIKKIVNKFPSLREQIRRNLSHTTIENLKNKKIEKNFNEIYQNLNNYKGIIIEYIWLDYLLPDEYKGIKIIDTHDIQSDRFETYKKQNKFCRFKICPNEEKGILEKYNVILVVSERDKKLLTDLKISDNKILFLPVYEEIKEIESSISKNIRLTFIGAAIDFNIDAINWFIENVFKKLSNNIELHIYGGVSNLVIKKDERIFLHGFVKDINEAYKNSDIIINPIQIGGGIKVKNIEALSKGKFLITTDVGAQGLEDGINKAFLVANTSDEFIKIINLYLKNQINTKEIKDFAINYIEKKLSYKKYYQEFFSKIKIKGK